MSYVDVDNTGGAREAVTHLVSSGRGVVALIAGPQDMIAGRDRLDGYRQALAAAGREVDESLVEDRRLQRGQRGLGDDGAAGAADPTSTPCSPPAT